MIPEDLPDEIKEAMKKMGISGMGVMQLDKGKCECDRCKGKTISSHYGVKDETFNKWVKEMICDMVMTNDKVKILDKWFVGKDELQDVRVKVLAYSAACERFMMMEMD